MKASFGDAPAGLDLYAGAANFVAGDNSTVNWGHYSSADGTNWTLRTPGLNNRTNFPGIRGIAYGANIYVAVGIGSAPGPVSSPDRIFTSQDGQTYVARPGSAVSPPLGTEGLTGVGFGGGVFVAIGNQGRILYSADGMAWQSPRSSDGFGWNRVRYLNNTWWTVGNGGRVASSQDGTNWTIKSTGVLNDLNDIATRNGYYLVVGNNGMALSSLFHASQPPRILSGSLIRFANGAFQFTVQSDASVLPSIQTSSNLVNWSALSPAPSNTPPDATGLVTFTDADAANHPRRFYRATVP